MTQDGKRFAADLKLLEDRKAELADTLERLNTDAYDADEIARLEHEISVLETEVEAARAELGNLSKGGDKTVRKRAMANKRRAEIELDRYAEHLREEGETFAKAYARVLDTDLGRSMIRNRDAAAALELGEFTSMNVACAGLTSG